MTFLLIRYIIKTIELAKYRKRKRVAVDFLVNKKGNKRIKEETC